ncbi:hypothetical protein H2198_000907 [Neophaeococcomyces mojaviensis]|uniref:Uncharacterized protein n=1 Tax=Neophaeococcomyces mojaviensis TaxID=3383035 RepID=A0ACC3AIS0_9EURO|nr:hypothetical protein H2198_000907 [Knufia sp. JES_112]
MTTSVAGGGSGGASTTTSSSSSSTTSSTGTGGGSGGSEICPDTPYGDEVNGYDIYCGYSVDPGIDNILVARPPPTDIATLEDCLALCDTFDECTGLSYFPSGTTCYLHGGTNVISADPRADYRGAIRVSPPSGSGGAATTTTTTTTGSGSGSTTTTSSSGSSTTTSAGGPGTTYSEPECSAPDGIISPDGTDYKVFCGEALTSVYTLPNPQDAATLTECVQLCDDQNAIVLNDVDKCISVTWLYEGPGPHYCYLHTGGDLIFNGSQGYHSAILADGTNDNDPCLDGDC